jgi:hypothetical protein
MLPAHQLARLPPETGQVLWTARSPEPFSHFVAQIVCLPHRHPEQDLTAPAPEA